MTFFGMWLFIVFVLLMAATATAPAVTAMVKVTQRGLAAKIVAASVVLLVWVPIAVWCTFSVLTSGWFVEMVSR